MFGSGVHLLDKRLVKYGLRHHITRSRGYLALKACNLGVEVLRIGIEGATHDEVSGVFDVFTGKVVAFVQSRDDLHQLNGVLIVDGRSPWLIAEFRRVSG